MPMLCAPEPASELTNPAAAPCQKFPPRIAEKPPWDKACTPANLSQEKQMISPAFLTLYIKLNSDLVSCFLYQQNWLISLLHYLIIKNSSL